jgi:tetratricopeptide (TPR) repeat protein
MENDLAARHIAYAKVQEKLGRFNKMIESLERAVELDPIPQTLTILADAYERNGQAELSAELRDKAAKMVIPEGQPKQVRQVRRVIM